MDIKINKDKFKKLLLKYLDSQDELKYANEHRTGYGNSVREFFYEYPNDGEDSDYEFVFTYYGFPVLIASPIMLVTSWSVFRFSERRA